MPGLPVGGLEASLQVVNREKLVKYRQQADFHAESACFVWVA